MIKYSLTASQKLLLYFQLLNRKKSDGNICGSFTIKEKVDFEKLKRAVNFVVKQNDSFRTRICFSGLSFKQYFKEYEPFDIEIIDVKTVDDVKNIENKMNHEVFSMLNKPLFNIIFFRFEDGTGGIICNMHHVICDAWTIGLAINEIMSYYCNEEIEIQSFPYYEHVKDEHNYLYSDLIKTDKLFWKDFFKNSIPPSATIKGDLNKENESRKTDYYKVNIPKEVVENIEEYCKKINISACCFYTGILSLFIGLELQTQELLLDTIISNRATFKEKHTTRIVCKNFTI